MLTHYSYYENGTIQKLFSCKNNGLQEGKAIIQELYKLCTK